MFLSTKTNFMAYLVLIGNGFDLAHGIKTGYSDFIKWSYNEYLSNQSQFPRLFEINSLTPKNWQEFRKTKLLPGKKENLFYTELLVSFANSNWCDIEQFYFDKLIKIANTNSGNKIRMVDKLHSDFQEVKSMLEKYLDIEKNKTEPIEEFQHFFNQIQSKPGVILDFNYTRTPELYFQNNSKFDYFPIHGCLNDSNNPIVFGYSALKNDLSKLSKLGSNFTENIKTFNYGISGIEKDFFKKISSFSNLTIINIGHSCGFSDLGILNKIFSNQKVRSIYTSYYNPDSFKSIQTNIYSILDDPDKFEKFATLPSCALTPQHNRSPEENEEFRKQTQSFFMALQNNSNLY